MLGGVIALALVFAFSNGFHDTSSAVAGAVTTRALTPKIALVVATVFNFIGAMIGEGIVRRVGDGIVTVPSQPTEAMALLGAALLAAILWNVVTWILALPNSSTHGLIGGLLGAGIAVGATTHWSVVGTSVLLPLLVSPLVGFAAAYGICWAVLHIVRRRSQDSLFTRFRAGQSLASVALSLAHGIQDAQKSLAIVVLALAAVGAEDGAWPTAARVAVALALAGGTLCGGWRIVRTLGERITVLDPVRGFVADSVTAAVLYVTAFAFRAPISMTYTVTAAIAGAGVPGRRRGTRARVVAPIVLSWIVALPLTGLAAALLVLLFTL
nr:inorganic phosphate transporter [Spelaeicoccus albus]